MFKTVGPSLLASSTFKVEFTQGWVKVRPNPPVLYEKTVSMKLFKGQYLRTWVACLIWVWVNNYSISIEPFKVYVTCGS